MWRLSLPQCGTGKAAIRRLTRREDWTFGTESPAKGALIKSVAQLGSFAIFRPLSDHVWGLPPMAHETDYKPGSMDISQHLKAYQGFITGSKWTFGFVMLIVIFLAVFRTN